LTHTAARLETFESLAAVAQAGERTGAQLLIWHAPELGPDALPALQAVQQAGSAVQLAVVYRYASSASTRALAAAGVASLREPADDDALGAWLASIEAGMSQQARKEPALETPLSAPAAPQLTPRRYDDATLTAIAGLSPTLACECPKHVAELLMQLSSFESYSAGCINRDAADARLHAYLQEVAAASRALFEAALERVARHEGLPLR
jgi:hypothetical protein